ncbi:hypothetical protein [Paenibacillus konkukensis]|uniref:hypothetical protein n=1 Tax=Paenibacillus konkukensis TaxID=2020716 RepID=UPI00201D587A|nr:hypothetical protein [Paenibacillus konkukensis]
MDRVGSSSYRYGLCLRLRRSVVHVRDYGGLAAVLFFVFDRFVPWFLQFGRKRTRAAVLATPLLLFGLLAGAVYAASPPLPPFTAADAAAFATSGSGTLIDLFPKQEGEVRKLQIEGYDVERETAVTPMKGKERYQVDFIERWSKGAENGEHRMSYEVTRGSMGAHGGGGAEPPYRR